MSEDRLPGEITPPGAEPPGGGGFGAGGESGADEGVPDHEGEPIGIFPTWGWLYATVVGWAALLVLLLYVFTVTFDFGAR